eukprot:CFRG2590T1
MHRLRLLAQHTRKASDVLSRYTNKDAMSSYKEQIYKLASRAGEKSSDAVDKLLQGTTEASQSAYSATSHKWNEMTASSNTINKYITAGERAAIGHPAALQDASVCRACGLPFVWTRRRHHCRQCGHSFCHEHSSTKDYVPAYGYAFACRTCNECHKTLVKSAYEQRVKWRMDRVDSFLDNKLQPFTDDSEDTPRHKAMRGAYFTLKTARYLPYTKQVARATDFIIKHGGLSLTQVLMESEITEAAALIRQLAGSISQEISMTDMIGGLYYLGTQRRWERGNCPEAEHTEHADCLAISRNTLRTCQEFAPHALKIVYQKTEVDIQRMLEHIGYELLFATTTSSEFKPAHYIAVNRSEKKVVVAIKGTDGLYDVMTDICIEGITWPLVLDLDITVNDNVRSAQSDSGTKENLTPAMVHKGMATGAAWMYQEVHSVVEKLVAEGYEPWITGHSLGGGVAALLTKVFTEVSATNCKGVVYGAPPVVTKDLVSAFDEMVVSVVLHDDVVPRASNRTAFVLIEELLGFREKWKPMWEQDVAAHQHRIKEIWAPKTRARSTVRNLSVSNKSALKRTVPASGPPLPTIDTSESVGIGIGTSVDWDTERSVNAEDTESLEENIAATKLTPLNQPPPGKPIPSLFSAGKLIHIYHHRGMFKAVRIPVDHPTMMRVELYSNMMTDHNSSNYYRVLHNLHLYGTPSVPPMWSTYEDVEVCVLCHTGDILRGTVPPTAMHNRPWKDTTVGSVVLWYAMDVH